MECRGMERRGVQRRGFFVFTLLLGRSTQPVQLVHHLELSARQAQRLSGQERRRKFAGGRYRRRRSCPGQIEGDGDTGRGRPRRAGGASRESVRVVIAILVEYSLLHLYIFTPSDA